MHDYVVTTYAYEHCRGPLPVPAGTSRFCIKGDFYRHMAETIVHLDAKTSGGLSALLAREGLRDFMTQQFLATSFYDNLPLPRLTMCIAEVTQRDVFALTTKMGESSAERSMSGVYNRLLAPLTTTTFHRHFPGVISFFYNYAPLTVTLAADGKSAELVRKDLPLAVAEWWCLVSVPFVKMPLEKNGAVGVDVKWRVAPSKAAGAVPLGDATWAVTWA